MSHAVRNAMSFVGIVVLVVVLLAVAFRVARALIILAFWLTASLIVGSIAVGRTVWWVLEPVVMHPRKELCPRSPIPSRPLGSILQLTRRVFY